MSGERQESRARDAAYWDERARTFGTRAAGDLRHSLDGYEDLLRQEAFNRLVKVRPGMRVLDLGCGLGRWSVRLAIAGCTVDAVDISTEMIRMARRHPGVRYLEGGVEMLDEPPATYDLTVCFTVLQHISDARDLDRTLSRVRLLTKSDGMFFALEYSPRGHSHAGGSGYLTIRSFHDWMNAFARSGFEVRGHTGVRVMPARLVSGYLKVAERLKLGVLAGRVGRGLERPLLRSRISSRVSDVHAFRCAPVGSILAPTSN